MWNEITPGFEHGLPCSFPMMITVTLQVPHVIVSDTVNLIWWPIDVPADKYENWPILACNVMKMKDNSDNPL